MSSVLLFYNWWSRRHIWRNVLLNLFLVTGELGTSCHIMSTQSGSLKSYNNYYYYYCLLNLAANGRLSLRVLKVRVDKERFAIWTTSIGKTERLQCSLRKTGSSRWKLVMWDYEGKFFKRLAARLDYRTESRKFQRENQSLVLNSEKRTDIFA